MCLTHSLVYQNHLWVLGDLHFHHTWGGPICVWSAFIRYTVLWPHLVKQDGRLREEVFVCWKSDSIWSGEMSQPPFKVEITPQVLVFIVFNWRLPIFRWFLYIFGCVKLDLDFSMCFYLVKLVKCLSAQTIWIFLYNFSLYCVPLVLDCFPPG